MMTDREKGGGISKALGSRLNAFMDLISIGCTFS